MAALSEQRRIGVAQRLWGELCKRMHTQEPKIGHAPAAWLDGIPARVRAGDLPKSLFQTDPHRALREVNQMRVQQLFIRYRRHIGGSALRGFMPKIDLTPPLSPYADSPTPLRQTAGTTKPPPVPFTRGSSQAVPWMRAADDPGRTIAYERQMMAAQLRTAATLHGGALVQLKVCTWDDIKRDGVAQWSRICDEQRDRGPSAEASAS